jgi:hypothetical protein
MNSPKRLLTASMRNSGCKLRSAQGAKPRFVNPELTAIVAIDRPRIRVLAPPPR